MKEKELDKYCKCGCGKKIIQKYKMYIPDYINGHQRSGKKCSDNTKIKISESKKGIKLTNKVKTSFTYLERNRKIVETRRKNDNYKKERERMHILGLSNKGKIIPEELKKRISNTLKGRVFTEEHRKKIGKALKNRIFSNEHRRKISEKSKIAGINRWSRKDFREKQIKAILKGLIKRPTSFETIIINLITKHSLPYKYTGDGSFLIGYKNPDFINTNGEKICIEVYANFCHPKNYEEVRSKQLGEYGWKVIFINENDIKDDSLILQKIGMEEKQNGDIRQ